MNEWMRKEGLKKDERGEGGRKERERKKDNKEMNREQVIRDVRGKK